MVNYLVSQARQRVREWLVRQMKKFEKQERREKREGGGCCKRERKGGSHPLFTHSSIPTPFFSIRSPNSFLILSFLLFSGSTLFSPFIRSQEFFFHASFNESLKTFEWLHKHTNDHLNVRWKERKNLLTNPIQFN